MRGRRPSGHPFTAVRLAALGTQAALAAALTAAGLATTRQAVSCWEQGRGFPSEERLVLLSLLMRVPPEQLDELFWPFLGDPAAQGAGLDA